MCGDLDWAFLGETILFQPASKVWREGILQVCAKSCDKSTRRTKPKNQKEWKDKKKTPARSMATKRQRPSAWPFAHKYFRKPCKSRYLFLQRPVAKTRYSPKRCRHRRTAIVWPLGSNSQVQQTAARIINLEYWRKTWVVARESRIPGWWCRHLDVLYCWLRI